MSGCAKPRVERGKTDMLPIKISAKPVWPTAATGLASPNWKASVNSVTPSLYSARSAGNDKTSMAWAMESPKRAAAEPHSHLLLLGPSQGLCISDARLTGALVDLSKESFRPISFGKTHDRMLLSP